MSKYQVKFYEGEYKTRQRAANADHAVAYVEHHFNAGSATANYAVVIVGSNASPKSKDWGRSYALSVSHKFDTKLGGDKGILVGGYQGRGNSNVVLTNMPAVLLEPLFASNPKHAEIIRSEQGQTSLAMILVDTIIHFFPHGGLVAFSVGHAGKPSAPKDRGAAVVGGGAEADYAEKILKKAELLLTKET